MNESDFTGLSDEGFKDAVVKLALEAPTSGKRSLLYLSLTLNCLQMQSKAWRL
jgi:hypothetical protein